MLVTVLALWTISGLTIFVSPGAARARVGELPASSSRPRSAARCDRASPRLAAMPCRLVHLCDPSPSFEYARRDRDLARAPRPSSRRRSTTSCSRRPRTAPGARRARPGCVFAVSALPVTLTTAMRASRDERRDVAAEALELVHRARVGARGDEHLDERRRRDGAEGMPLEDHRRAAEVAADDLDPGDAVDEVHRRDDGAHAGRQVRVLPVRLPRRASSGRARRASPSRRCPRGDRRRAWPPRSPCRPRAASSASAGGARRGTLRRSSGGGARSS